MRHFVFVLATLLCSPILAADVLHSTLQAVDGTGGPAYPANGFPITMTGIILNNPADMSNSTPNFNTIPFDVSTYWQVFVQTTALNDFGGTAVYMAQNYGNIPPGGLTFPGGVPTPDPTNSYPNNVWQSQVNRVNSYAQNSPGTLPSAGYQLQAGDLVQITARGGLFFGGKFNVNERHTMTADYNSDPGFSFDITYLGHPGLPTPIALSLSDIWDTGTNAVKFDATRATGGEHYQGDYVTLDSVRLLPGQDVNWHANNGDSLAIVEDAFGHQFPIQLGTNELFTPANAPVGWFNATGIFDQEVPSNVAVNTGFYQLWVMDPSLVVQVPEPSTVIMLVVGLVGLLGFRLRK